MSNLIISSITEQFVEDTKEIFFESSPKKSFKDFNEKQKFSYKYFDYYLQHHREYFLIARQDLKVLGYVCAALESKKCSELYELLPHYNIFEDQFDSYPAHLHMNTHYSSRGMGVGSQLVDAFVERFSNLTSGVHIITSPSAQNVHFYEKNKFEKIIEKDFLGSKLLFMGRKL